MSLHKSLPGEEIEAAVFLMEVVRSTFRISKQGRNEYLLARMEISSCIIYNHYSQRTLSPFCNVLQDVEPPVRTCSVDRDLFAECSLIEHPPGDVPPEFQVVLMMEYPHACIILA